MPKDDQQRAKEAADVTKLSCLPCKQRKSKCDRNEPCSSCILRHTERLCYANGYKTRVLNKTEKRLRTHSRASLDSGSGKAEISLTPEDQFDTSSNHANHSPGQVSNTNLSSYIENLLDTIETLKTNTQSLQLAVGNEAPHNRRDVFDNASDDLVWNDLTDVLPPKEDCEALFDIFFSSACWQNHLVNQDHFRNAWQELVEGGKASTRFVALILVILALSVFVAPDHRPECQLKTIPDRHSLYLSAYQLSLLRETNPCINTAIGVEELQVRCLITTYTNFTGWCDHTWLETGKAIRLGKAIHLFDEDKWMLQELNDWDIEIRRRIALDLTSKDRWLSLQFGRMTDLPFDYRPRQPKFYSSKCYDAHSRNLLPLNSCELVPQYTYEMSRELASSGAMQVNLFLTSFHRWSSLERCNQARELDEFLYDIEEKRIHPDLKYPQACNIGILNTPDKYQRACQSIIYYLSVKRLRCFVMRQFLIDKDDRVTTPMEFQVAALEHARKIIETIPMLVTLSSSPLVSFSSSWCSDHLFQAASTFAIVSLEEKEDQELKDLDWFASKVFEVVEALAILGKKDRVAKRCQELLTAICIEKPWLQRRLAIHRNSRLFSQSAESFSGTYKSDVGSKSDKAGLAYDPPRMAGQSESPSASRSDRGNGLCNGSIAQLCNNLMRNTSSSIEAGYATFPTITDELTSSTFDQNALTTMPFTQDEIDSKLAGWNTWHLLNDEEWATVLRSLQ